MTKVILVSTIARMVRDGKFVDDPAWPTTSKIGHAPYEIDLSKIKSKLAQFLAEHVSSTAFKDSGSHCVLVYGHRRGAYEAAKLMVDRDMLNSALSLAAGKGRLQFVEALRQLADKIEETERKEMRAGLDELAGYGSSTRQWDHLRIEYFQWPVYGSGTCDAETPEEYFEVAARLIRRMGAVPVAVGYDKARPADGLLKSLASGAGLCIAARYDAEVAAHNAAHNKVRVPR